MVLFYLAESAEICEGWKERIQSRLCFDSVCLGHYCIVKFKADPRKSNQPFRLDKELQLSDFGIAFDLLNLHSGKQRVYAFRVSGILRKYLQTEEVLLLYYWGSTNPEIWFSQTSKTLFCQTPYMHSRLVSYYILLTKYLRYPLNNAWINYNKK